MAQSETKPAFSFAGLSVEDAPKFVKAPRNGKSKFESNPLVAHVKTSADRKVSEKDGSWFGAPLQITVPGDEVGNATSLLRNAGDQNNVGVNIAYSTKGGKILRYVSVGAQAVEKDGKTVMRGGKMQLQTLDGKPHTVDTVITFRAKNPRPVADPK